MILDIEEKEKRIQATITQLEMKGIELLRFKAAAEIAKVIYIYIIYRLYNIVYMYIIGVYIMD